MGRRENRFKQQTQRLQSNGDAPQGFMPQDQVQAVVEEIAQRRSQHAQFGVITAQKIFIEAVTRGETTDLELAANVSIEASRVLCSKLVPFAEEIAKAAPLPAHMKFIEDQIEKQRAEMEKNDPLDGSSLASLVS